MDTKGLEFLNLNNWPANNIRPVKKSVPAIKPVESIMKASRSETAVDTRRHKNNSRVIPLPLSPDEKNAQLASEILAEDLADSPELKVSWRYDHKKQVLIVEVKNNKSGEVVKQLPPENILNSRSSAEAEGSGFLLNKMA